MTENKFYSYSGFGKPQEVAIEDLVIESNYLGDVTNDFLEVYEEYKNESDEELNEHLGYYGVYRNPKKSVFQEMNTCSYGLAKNEYLEDWEDDKKERIEVSNPDSICSSCYYEFKHFAEAYINDEQEYICITCYEENVFED